MLLDATTCYSALQARDSRFDGQFFCGVASTGIYCRPVCRARTPKAENCSFYASAAAAGDLIYVVSGINGSAFIFGSVFYTGQTDCSACMDSADGYAHVYNVNSSTLHFDWHVTNNGWVTDGGALAVAFKGQG